MSWLGLADTPTSPNTPSIEQAAAVLMVEIMHADQHWDDVESAKIIQLLIDTFSFSSQEAQTLLAEAQASVENANDLYTFTRVVNEHFTLSQKESLIKSLWRVAYADQNLDRYEEHMIRKIAELLYVPHSRFIKAKLEAAEQPQ